jgi:drug/metabolite transporter (DMT)-like permease
LFSAVLFKEGILPAEVICVMVAFCGIGILYDFSFEGALSGQAMALTAGVLAGLAVAVIHKLRETNGSAIIYFYFCMVGSVMTAPFFMRQPKIPQNMNDLFLVITAVCFITVAQLLMTQAFRYCKSWEGGILLMFEIIFTAALCIAVLQEVLTWQLIIGGSLVVSSALGLNLVNARRKHAKLNKARPA